MRDTARNDKHKSEKKKNKKFFEIFSKNIAKTHVVKRLI